MWTVVQKADPRCLELADRHYTRQRPGTKQWTRPGYNCVMLAEFRRGTAIWAWWRPKWEDGRPGTSRKDGLRVVECTMFRREGTTPLASEMIRAAVAMLSADDAAAYLHLDTAGPIDGLITGVSSRDTTGGRSPRSEPGACYRHAGWVPVEKRTGRADVWLWHPWPQYSAERKD